VTTKFNDWLQIVSNVGIIVGLLLVALQMRQASVIAAAQLNSEYFMNSIESFGSLSGDDAPAAWARAEVNAPDLTDTELSVVRYYLTRQWLLAVRVGALSDSGFSAPADNPGFVEGWVNTLGNETALRWWQVEHDRVLAFVPSLRDAVDARLQEVGPDHAKEHLRILAQMRSGPLPGEPAAQR